MHHEPHSYSFMDGETMNARTQVSLYKNLKNLLESARNKYAQAHKVKAEDVRPVDIVRAALELYTATDKQRLN